MKQIYFAVNAETGATFYLRYAGGEFGWVRGWANCRTGGDDAFNFADATPQQKREALKLGRKLIAGYISGFVEVRGK